MRASTPAAEQHAVRQDDRHRAVVPQVMQPVQQEREVGRALGGHAVVLEPGVLGRPVFGGPAVAEGDIDLLQRWSSPTYSRITSVALRKTSISNSAGFDVVA